VVTLAGCRYHGLTHCSLAGSKHSITSTTSIIIIGQPPHHIAHYALINGCASNELRTTNSVQNTGESINSTVNSDLQQSKVVILLPPTQQEVNAFARVCLSVC